MARYTGPKWKISRRENASVFGDDQWMKRQSFPGQHPTSMRKPSNYNIQLREKQKVKRMYGLMEKQFRNIYKLATSSEGNTGTRLLQLLELRLDNVVHRLGYGSTRNQARQIVSHGHVLVNAKRLNIPSYSVKVGDEITVKGSDNKTSWTAIIREGNKDTKFPAWVGTSSNGGVVKSVPTRDMIDPTIKEQLIVEFYSR